MFMGYEIGWSASFPPVRGGHIMARVSTGTQVLLAAPPAGYLNAILHTQVKNAHATNALNYRLTDADGEFMGPTTNTLAAGSNSLASVSGRPLWIGDSNVSITVSGTGTPAEIIAEWHQIPIPAGWTKSVLALTTAYQTVPNAVPLVGLARQWSPIRTPQGQGLGATLQVWNGDSAAVQIQWRLIRDGVTFDWNHGNGAGSTSAAFSNAALATPIALVAGDQLQVKVASIGVPGAAILRSYWETMVAAS